MRALLAVTIFSLTACDGDSGADVELPAQSYVLSRVDGQVVPAETHNIPTGNGRISGRILKGSLVFDRPDSAKFTLHSIFGFVNATGQFTSSEEMCNTAVVGYRFDGRRVFLDLEIPPRTYPPSTGIPSTPGVSLHDTLVVSGTTLSGTHKLKFVPEGLRDDRVHAEYFAAPVMPNQCDLPD
jgi:hypothetical protein